MSPSPKWWLGTVASLLGIGVAVAACAWQWGRGVEKDRLAEQADRAARAAPLELPLARSAGQAFLSRRVIANGVFVAAATVFTDNQVREGRPGYLVFSALRLSNGRHVLVKRGWVAGDPVTREPPAVPTPAGVVGLTGIALSPAPRFFELGAAPLTGQVWQNVTVARFEERFGLEFEPLILEQHTTLGDGLDRAWPKAVSPSSKHYGYAFQWGALAILIVVFNVLYRFRSRADPRTP